MSFELGINPQRFPLYLTQGADYGPEVMRLRNGGALVDWPAGTVLTLEFGGGTAWTATIAGPDATFTADRAEADQIPNHTPVKLRYVNGETDQVWAIGKVVRRDG